MSIWDEIDETEWLPFAKFEEYGKNVEIYIQIVDEEPSIFTNRWGKEQFSIRVWKYNPQPKGNPKLELTDDENDYQLLVGGVRLFRTLKGAKDFDGILRVRRLGSGFSTNYKIIQKIDIKD